MNSRDKAIEILENPNASKDAKELARMVLRGDPQPMPYVPAIPPSIPPYKVPDWYPGMPHPWQVTC